MAVARNVVVLPAMTMTGRPDDPNMSAVPVAAGGPVQLAVVYTFTVEPSSAVPLTAGVVDEAGDDGVTDRPVGGAGAAESLV